MTSTGSIAEQILPHVIRDAAERGIPLTDMLRLLVRSVAGAYPLPEARFAVAGLGGRFALLAMENGCVDAKKAAQAYVGPHPRKKANAETVRKAARERRLIAVRDGHGDLLFPVWQFAETGGLLPGLTQVLMALGERPGYSDITPFVFFLQPHPRTRETPLSALRAGRIDQVVAAARSELD
jgi:hypothetical protein